MKKIEEQIIKTFGAQFNNNYNMEITLSPHDKVEGYAQDIVIYRLDDKAIFRYEPKEKRFSFTLAGNNTPTTRSRLRALLGYFCNVLLLVKQGKLYLVDNDAKMKIDTNTWYLFKLRKEEENEQRII